MDNYQNKIATVKTGKSILELIKNKNEARDLQDVGILNPPENELQAELADIWKKIIPLERIGVDQNFFQSGGSSLKAVQLISRISKMFNQTLTVADVFNHPTIRKLSILLEKEKITAFSPIVALPEREFYELSHGQKRLWMVYQLHAKKESSHIHNANDVEGLFDIEIFKQALFFLVKRHEILRTIFCMVEGQPRQSILPIDSFSIPLEFEDLSPEGFSEQLFRDKYRDETSRLFDLENGPLFRIKILGFGEKRKAIIFTIHHIITDAWSTQIFIDEVLAYYDALINGEKIILDPLRIQYKDFAAYQNELLKNEVASSDRSYWMEQFRIPVQELRLPTDKKRSNEKSYNGSNLIFEFDPIMTQSIRAFSSRQEVTLFIFFVAVVKSQFYRYTNQSDIVIGSPIAGRTHFDLEPLIGFFVNHLAIRTIFSKDDTFHELLMKVKKNCIDAYHHQLFPFDLLFEELGLENNKSRSPLFDTQVIYQDGRTLETKQRSNDKLIIRNIAVNTTVSKHDITFTFIEEENKISLNILFDTELFSEERIKQIVSHLKNLISFVIKDDLGTPIKLVDYLSDKERSSLLSYSEKRYSQPFLIHQKFEAQAEKYPEEIAVIYKKTALTYRDLNSRANKLAYLLIKSKNIGRNQRVGILMDPSIEMVISILAILKAGGCFVPIDPEYPYDRIRYLIEDATVSSILLDNSLKIDLCPTEQHSKIMIINGYEISNFQEPGSNPEHQNNASDLCYILWTSGSTGKPKGVMITHESLCNYTNWFDEFHKQERDSSVLLSSFCFDGVYTSIFGTLLSGGCLHILDKRVIHSPKDLLNYISRHRIGFLKITPSLLNILLSTADLQNVELSLNLIVVGGEAIKVSDIEKLLTLYPDIKVINHYGPTESTIGVCYFEITKYNLGAFSQRPVIGSPIPNVGVYILDENEQLLPRGIDGEIYIAGESNSIGYLNKPELTAEKFITEKRSHRRLYKTGDIGICLEDGNIQLLGRKDHQVKIRGYRIELIEIERALSTFKLLTDSAVIMREGNDSEHAIFAYFIAPNEVTEEDLRNHLGKSLPSYMIPSRFIKMESFPYMSTGKLDRKKLAQVEVDLNFSALKTPSRNSRDNALIEIWKEVLNFPEIGIDDDFFKLGGHSLKAIQIVSRIYKILNARIELIDIFNYPTIRALSDLIESRSSHSYESIPKIDERPYYELSFAQKRLWIFDQFKVGQSAYNQPRLLLIDGELDRDAFEKAFELLVQRHEIMRTVYITVNDEPFQKILSFEESGFKVDYVDLTNSGHNEEQLRAAINADASIPFELSRGPLIKVKLMKLEPALHAFSLITHHIISDGWSIQILTKEFFILYNACKKQELNPLPTLKIQYKDYAYWQKNRIRMEDENYWLSKLSGELKYINLPYDYAPKSHSSFIGGIETIMLNNEILQRLKVIASRYNTTLSNVILAVYNIFLCKISNQNDLVIGVATANRNHADIERLLGFFVNILVIRNSFSPDDNFEEILKAVNTSMLEAFDHQDYPFDLLVQKINPERISNVQPIFNVCYGFESFNDISLQFESDSQLNNKADLKIESASHGFRMSKYDLTMFVTEVNQGLKVSLEYNAELFRAETIKNLLRIFDNFLTQSSFQ